MADAPTPGGDRKAKKRSKDATESLRLTLQGEQRVLRIGVLPFFEKDLVCKPEPIGTGQSLEEHMRRLGEVTFAVLWWLARRQDGETNLTWWELKSQWPTGLIPGDDYSAARIVEDDSPEA